MPKVGRVCTENSVVREGGVYSQLVRVDMYPREREGVRVEPRRG